MRPFQPRISPRALYLATTVRNFLTRSRASRFYGPGAPASCPRSTEPRREGRADRGADRLLSDERIAAQGARIAAQDARIAALEARLDELTRPPKTPGNSSKPPSQGQKQNLRASAADRPPRKSRLGVGRTLHPHPDRTIDRRLSTCPKCEAVFPDASQVYERIELPPVRRM